jgi:hypothetical protein
MELQLSVLSFSESRRVSPVWNADGKTVELIPSETTRTVHLKTPSGAVVPVPVDEEVFSSLLKEAAVISGGEDRRG